MKTLDLTSPAKARAYLESLGPDTIIELPAAGMRSAAADAVGVLAEQDASVFAREFGRWEWTVKEVLDAARPYAKSAAKVAEILGAKTAAGPSAFLWLHGSGDCILWPDEASAENDPGTRALARWSLDEIGMQALIATGEVDDLA